MPRETKAEKKSREAPINERSLLRKKDAADYLSVSIATFSRMVRNGDFKPVEVRGGIRFRRLDLDRYVESLPEAKPRRVGCTA